jgi:hypothetical protein
MTKTAFRRHILVGAVASVAATSAFAFPSLKFSQIAAFDPGTITFDPDAATVGLSLGDTGAAITDGALSGVDGFNWRGQNYAAGDPPQGQSEIAITSFGSSISAGFQGDFAGIEILGSTVNTSAEWVENEWWVIDQLTQINRNLTLIPGTSGSVPDPLWEVETVANFRVFDPDDNLLTADLGSRSNFEFFETVNSSSGCALNIPGSPFCSDVYRVSFSTFAPLDPFIIDGVVYTVDFTLVPGPTLDGVSPTGTPFGETLVCLSSADPGCTGAEVAAGEINVYTPEFNPGESNIFVAARWRAADIDIPAPSGIALFGAGLLTLGGFVRRKASGKA